MLLHARAHLSVIVENRSRVPKLPDREVELHTIVIDERSGQAASSEGRVVSELVCARSLDRHGLIAVLVATGHLSERGFVEAFWRPWVG